MNCRSGLESHRHRRRPDRRADPDVRRADPLRRGQHHLPGTAIYMWAAAIHRGGLNGWRRLSARSRTHNIAWRPRPTTICCPYNQGRCSGRGRVRFACTLCIVHGHYVWRVCMEDMHGRVGFACAWRMCIIYAHCACASRPTCPAGMSSPTPRMSWPNRGRPVSQLASGDAFRVGATELEPFLPAPHSRDK